MSDDDGGAVRRRASGACSATGSASPPPATSRRRGRTSRPRCPTSSASAALGQADKAWFTNFGGWVDACAPAIDVVSTFFLGDRTAPGSTSRRSPAGRAGAARASRRRRSPPSIAQEMYLTASTPRDVVEAAVGLPALPVPRPRHRVQRLTPWPTSSTSTGPLGALGAGAGPPAHRRRRRRRRAAVPRPPGLRRRRVRRRRLRRRRSRSWPSERSTCSAAASATSRRRAAPSALRPAPAERPHRRPERWGIAGLAPVDGAAAVGPLRGPPEPGVPRRRRRPGTSGASGRPARRAPRAFTNPAAVSSTARPAAAPAHLAAHRCASPGRRPPNVLVLDTGLRTFDAHAEHPWLRDHCVDPRAVARPRRRSGAGTTRTSPTTTTRPARPPGRARHVHQRDHPPAAARTPSSTTGAC